MDWQQTVSLAIVAAAAVLLLWGKIRRRTVQFEREVPCGCAAGASPGAGLRSSIVFHARKGQRPEVRVRMR